MNPGERVKVTIPKARRDEWAQGAAESLQGHTGVVEEVQTCERMTKHPLKEPRVLVRFDVIAEPWSANQSPAKAWWFDESELTLIRERI